MRTSASAVRVAIEVLHVLGGLLVGYVGMLSLIALFALPLQPLISHAFPRLAWDEPALSPYVAPTMCLAGVAAAWLYARLRKSSKHAAVGFGAGAAFVVLCALLLPLWIPVSRYVGPIGRAMSESLAAWSVAAGVTGIVGVHTALVLVGRGRRAR
jgi:hypothetical protein